VLPPILIGHTDEGEPIELTEQDLATHVHGIGASRFGKSKWLEWFARENILAGQGFCLIDPEGTAYNNLVEWLAYIDAPPIEVILFNPSYPGRVVGFNPFRRRKEEVGVQAERMLSATLKAWGQDNPNQTPELERWLRGVYHALLNSGYSLPFARYLVSWDEKVVRQHLVRHIPDDGMVRSQWNELEQARTSKDFREPLRATLNRFSRLLDSRQIRRLMGLGTNNLDFEDIIEGNKVLLVNLQQSSVLTQVEARLLGTLLISDIWEAALGRETPGGLPKSHWHLLIDEFHNFLTPDMPLLLDRAAKRGIHCFLFHQRLGHLKQDPSDANIADAVMTNAQVKLIFGGLRHEDAETMANEIFDFDLNETKYLIEHTTAWPLAEDVEVTTTTRGGTRSSSTSSAEDDPEDRRTTEGQTESFGETTSSQQWTRYEERKQFTPVKYTLEEQRYRAATVLKRQYRRHFFLKRPSTSAIGLEAPFVETFQVEPEFIAAYTDRLLAPFLPPAEVDRLYEAERAKLLEAAGQGPKALAEFDGGWEPAIDSTPATAPPPALVRRRKPSPKR
jgi:hypothetical protein